jgi:hypothetical protein
MQPDYLATIITSVAPILFSVLTVAAIWCYQWLAQRLPEKQRIMLDHMTNMAVKHTEQLYGDMTQEMKKEAAMQLTENLFRYFHLPVPPPTIISAAIEAAVFSLPETYTDEEKEIHPLDQLSLGKLQIPEDHKDGA